MGNFLKTSDDFYKVWFNPHCLELLWLEFKVAILVKSLNAITLSHHALEKLFRAKFVRHAGGIFARTVFDHFNEVADFEFWLGHMT